MSSVHLTLSNSNNTYSPGEEINGTIECFFSSKKTINAVKVKLKGKGETSWEESESYTDSDNNTQHRNVTYSASETYLNKELTLMQGSVNIPAGRHVYTFSCILPESGLPQSYEGKYGYTRYHIKAIIVRSWSSDLVAKIPLTIFAPLDLNSLPYLRNPITTSIDKNMWHCCVYDAGTLTFNMSLPATGFIPGQDVPVGAYVQNLTNVNTTGVKFEIIQFIRFKARHPSFNTKYRENIIVNQSENGIGAHGEKSWTTTLKIPTYYDYPNLDGCSIIEIRYSLKAKVIVAGSRSNLKNKTWLVIGHVPLTGVCLDFTAEPPPLSELVAPSSSSFTKNPPSYEEI